MASDNQIKCPNCDTIIDVQDLLAHQLEEEIKKKYQNQLNEAKHKFEKEFETLNQAKNDFEEKKKQENELFQDRFEKKIKDEKKIIEEKLKAKLQEDQAEQFSSLQKELNEKSEQIKELNRTKAEIEKLKREKDELKESIEADLQKKLNETLFLEKEKIKKIEEDKNEMKFREMQKQLEDQKRLTEEMKRKQEQGSMQLQGEVQELAIEEWLRNQFPLDEIQEIKKGALGADTIQFVNTREQEKCGVIYYESKRTKDYQPAWIKKFKEDMRSIGAEIGVLVTQALPKDMDRMAMIDGIWVCTFDEFKSLSFVLRDSIIRVASVAISQENKGDKMHMLYDYLSGSEFKARIDSIVEAFTYMQEDLTKEKKSTLKRWSEREKYIYKVMENTIGLYGSIKGIAGAGVPEIKGLIDDEQDLLE